MDYDKIKYAVLGVYERCSINKLPFDCIYVISELGYSCFKYSDMNIESYAACLKLSDDAHTIDGKIYYNDKKPRRRIKFSLMHELGHLVLDTEDETEANVFASNILAPSMAVYYSRLRNIREIANLFDISLECAKYAYESCQKWVYSAKHYGMTDIDKKMYYHFYDEEARRFVFKKAPCAYCDTFVYNSNKPLCNSCEKPHYRPLTISDPQDDFMIAESQWLYGGL